MVDHLFLSLKPPPPPLIFPCFPRRPWRRSSFSGEIRFPARVLLRLTSSASPSHSSSSSPPDSAPLKIDVVSTMQLHDGSHVFRFGDASEIERNAETEETVSSREVEEEEAEIEEEVDTVSVEQAVKEEDSVRLSEWEGPIDKCNSETEPVNSNVKTAKEERAAPTNRTNVIKIKDRKRARSPSKKKKEALSPVSVSLYDDKVETKDTDLSKLNLEVSSTAAVPIISGEVNVSVSGEPNHSEAAAKLPSLELVSEESEMTKQSETAAEFPSLELVSEESETTNHCGTATELSSLELASETHGHPKVMENAVDNEVIARSSSSDCSETHDSPQITKKDMESQTRPELSSSEVCSENHDLQEGAQEKTGIKVMRISTIDDGSKLNTVENPIVENDFVEPEAIAVVSPNELSSTSVATLHTVDESAEMLATDSSEVAVKTDDGEILNSTKNEKTSMGDSDTRGDDAEVFATEITEPESIETASGREEIASKGFYLDSGFASLQNPSKALAGREDAYFISHQTWLGVADGVSQWSFEGINPGVFAQELLTNCQKIISDETAQITDPLEVLSRSVSETKSHGSSTALVAHFDSNELHVANIGDSGFMVIRNGMAVQKSSPMFHEFGFPLQITEGDDPLKLAEVHHVNLDEGDVIITATDGLFDNLYEKEIASIVSSSLQQNLEPQKTAELLAAKAQEVGRSVSTRTPFAEAAEAAGYKGYKGGKLDVVTVIVSLVRTQ